MIGRAVRLTAAVFVAELDGAFEQPAVEIEHVAGIGLAAGRAAEQQRKLAIGGGLLGQIVVNAERRLALPHEIFGHRAAGVGGDVLQRGGIGGAGDDHGRVFHRAVALEHFHDAGDGGFLLPDRDVEAFHARAFLVDDRVEGDGGFAGLAVADDQLALAAADGDHAVDGLDAGLQRLLDRLALGDAGGDDVHLAGFGGWRWPGRRRVATPSGLTTRPMTASPTGTSSSRPVLLTVSPSLMCR